MSSTRNAEGYSSLYQTPLWATRLLLEEVYLQPGAWLEPMAGDGHIIRALYEDRPDAYQVTAVECRKECIPFLREIPNVAHVHEADFLTWDARAYRGAAELCSNTSYFTGSIMNPAFEHTMETLSKCLAICDQVYMLQRINWLGSGANNGKNDFFRACMPNVYAIPDRVRFFLNGAPPRDENGKLMSGDSIEYAWFHWGPKESRMRSRGEICTLRHAGLEERRRG